MSTYFVVINKKIKFLGIEINAAKLNFFFFWPVNMYTVLSFNLQINVIKRKQNMNLIK